jgi:Restriction endonuclease fold toxin 7
VSEVSRQAVVHNLTVVDLHTYFVVLGDAPTLVHNCGGAGPVRLGQQGEDAVRAVEEIGDKTPFLGASGQNRIADGMTTSTITEVKNVAYQGLTSQIRDYIAFARSGDVPLRFELWVRPNGGTRISGPLQEAIDNRQVVLREIP